MAAFPEVDLGPLHADQTQPTNGDGISSQDAACKALVDACHRWGFVRLRNHGVPKQLLDDALAMQERLFNLPHEEKMKAPHPPGFMPHRGYTRPGLEQSYSWTELDKARAREDGEGIQRDAKDYRESYDIGSNDNAKQPNVWLPESVLPGFQAFEMKLYWELEGLVRKLLHAFARGLELPQQDERHLDATHSGHNHQLRLLHYPEMSAVAADQSHTTRMSPHVDWGSFTLLIQDTIGGLELQDPEAPGTFVTAAPDGDTIVLNIGDMLMRATNGYLPSALHRVAAPLAVDGKLPSRYSIPYFVCPDDVAVIKTLDSFVRIADGKEEKYETIKFVEYSLKVSEFLHVKE